MNACLTKLGVPPVVQQFFNVESTVFDYGGKNEHFNEDIHFLPATNNLWLAGNQLASQVIITYSAMEAVAFLTLNHSNFPDLNNLLFVAIGTRLYEGQLRWIRTHLKKRSFTLVFGTDLLGLLTDIKIAAGITNRDVKIYFKPDTVELRLQHKTFSFDQQKISLHSFEQVFAVRTKVRTVKPFTQLTFLDELKNDTSGRHTT